MIQWHLLLGFWWMITAHPIHVSVTEMDYNVQTKTFEVAQKLFIDDLELALEKSQKLPYRIGTDNELKNADQYIEQYLKKHFKVMLNGQPQSWRMLGKEADIEAVWVYIEMPFPEQATRFEIQNSVLIDLYDDQQNLLHVNYLSKKTSYFFKKESEVETIKR